jgi:hypothetical protein
LPCYFTCEEINCTVTIAEGVNGLVGFVFAAKDGRDTSEDDTAHIISNASCVSASEKKFIAAIISEGTPELFLAGIPNTLLESGISTPFFLNHISIDSVELPVF